MSAVQPSFSARGNKLDRAATGKSQKAGMTSSAVPRASAAAALRIARSGSRETSARVSRVSLVAKANASASGPLPAAQVRNWRYARA